MSGAAPGDARAAEQLRALGHPARLAILRRLLRGDAPVAAIESELGIHQPALSQHLGALRTAGILGARRNSRSMIYGFADADIRRICSAVLAAFANAAPVPSAPAQDAAPPRARPESAHFATIHPRPRG